MATINEFFQLLSSFLWGWPMIVLLLGTHVFLTVRLRLPLYIVALFFGSIINLDIIWNIADSMNALMTIPNLVALLLLSRVAAQETKQYLWADRLDEEMEE